MGGLCGDVILGGGFAECDTIITNGDNGMGG